MFHCCFLARCFASLLLPFCKAPGNPDLDPKLHVPQIGEHEWSLQLICRNLQKIGSSDKKIVTKNITELDMKDTLGFRAFCLGRRGMNILISGPQPLPCMDIEVACYYNHCLM